METQMNKLFNDPHHSYLIVIGNGFDLAHNLRTSYNDFLKYLFDLQVADLKKSKSNKAIKNNLFTLKKTGGKTDTITYENLIRNPTSNKAVLTQIQFTNKLFKSFVENISRQNWCDIESVYFKELEKLLYPSLHKRNPYKNPKELNIDFKYITSHLEAYLQKVYKDTPPSSIASYSSLFKKLPESNTMILNFNYTQTIALYNSVISEKILINHIHGELNNVDNPIIFGFAANHVKSRELLQQGDKEFMRNIKKHCYKRTDKEDLLRKFLSRSYYINVIILGHSCGTSDQLILNQILNNNKVEKIWTLYYECYEHYFGIQVNMDLIMNNDENFKKLINMTESHRMPQWNDIPTQVEAFQDFIR